MPAVPPVAHTPIASGWWPTGIGVPALSVARSTGVTVPSPKFATSAVPWPPALPGTTATASGSSPTSTVAVTAPLAASTTLSVSAPSFATSSDRPPGATASAAGWLAVVTAASVRWPTRSTGVTVLPGWLTNASVATHASCPAAARPAGVLAAVPLAAPAVVAQPARTSRQAETDDRCRRAPA